MNYVMNYELVNVYVVLIIANKYFKNLFFYYLFYFIYFKEAYNFL